MHTLQDRYGQEKGTSQGPPDNEISFMDYQCNMTSAGENSTEACRPNKSLLMTKEILNIRNWNVCTMYAIGKSVQVTKEMKEYNIYILGISE